MSNNELVLYIKQLISCKEEKNLTWQDIADIVAKHTGFDRSETYFRKGRYNNIETECEENIEFSSNVSDKVYKALEKDTLTEMNACTRISNRLDSLKVIATESAKIIAQGKGELTTPKTNISNNEDREGILCIGDWHYGIDTDTPYNKYNLEIAKQRVQQLLEEAIKIIKKEKLSKVTLINLGDMISGRIHLQLRVSTRIDTVTQTQEVAELIVEFIQNLSKYVYVDYYSVTDNHSRIEPNKKNSLQLETFSRIIDWHIVTRLENNTNFRYIENTFGDDIATINVFNHYIVAVHGDLDSQKSIISNMTLYQRKPIDLIISAHMHHVSMDEDNNTEFICNGSLIGEDDYAHKLRKACIPSQMLLIATKDNATEVMYKIKLK